MKALQPQPRRRRKLPPLDLKRLVPWRAVITFAVIMAVGLFLLRQQVDIQDIHAYADRLNGGIAFALLVVLPLIGFPASILHVAAGIRFGVPLGLPLVALSILLQLLASYALVHLFRDRFERRLAPLKQRIPSGAHPSICVLTVLLPGAPFAAINYVLPLVGVPLRTYLLCCLPIHALRSTITVTLGDQSDRLTAARLAVFAAYALLILGASWLTYRRVKSRLEGQPSEADGRKLPA
jgi:uncharacterized membrane protein YdjX (TVP38/TMEM64 family)